MGMYTLQLSGRLTVKVIIVTSHIGEIKRLESKKLEHKKREKHELLRKSGKSTC